MQSNRILVSSGEEIEKFKKPMKIHNLMKVVEIKTAIPSLFGSVS